MELSSYSNSSDSSDEPQAKRKKRASMFYKRYTQEDGTEHIPRTTKLRLEKALVKDAASSSRRSSSSNDDNILDEDAPSSSRRSSRSSSKDDAQHLGQEITDNAAQSFDSASDSSDNFQANDEELSDSSPSEDSFQDAGSFVGLGETHLLEEENSGADSPINVRTTNTDSENSVNSGNEENSASVERPTIKLGDFEFLNNKYKLDEPLINNVVETSKFESLLMILSFALQEGLSYVGIGSLLNLVNHIFGQVVIPASLKVFKSLFNCNIGMSYYFYCPKCKCHLGTYSALRKEGNHFVCPVSSCKRQGNLTNMNDGHFFMYIPIPLETQLKVFLETKENIMELLSYRFSREQRDNAIRDVFDGELYRNLSGPGGILSNPNNFSVTLNTDGSPIFKSVKNTMWPIQCRLNELPPRYRFQSDNMFVCGVWFGKEEPDMNLFLSQYVKESCLLYEQGFEWNLNGELVKSRVVTLNCCLDSRAKPDVQCHKQLHSYDGCSYCYHPGNLVNLNRNFVVCQNNSSSEEDDPNEIECEDIEEGEVKKTCQVKAVRYPVSNGGFYYERTDEDIREDMAKSDTDGKIHRGIKGTSVMTLVPLFNMCSGFVIDYMHCILLGVVKTCLHLWLDKKRSREHYYIRNAIEEINKRLLNLRPPSNISRRPRSLADFIHFKANEFRAWLFFYSLPCLKGILPDLYFKHFSLLVTAMAILCSDCILYEDLDKAKGYLDLFVTDFENLYGPAFMVHNVHITSHLPLIVKSSGPSWSHSAFSFESGNGILKNLVKGTVGVMSQIAMKYMTYRCAPLFINHFTISKAVVEYCEGLVPKRLSKCAAKYDDITVLGNAAVSPLSDQQQEILRKSMLPHESLLCFYRAIIQGTVYHSLNYPKQGKKSNDSVVKLKDGSFAVIERILVHSQKIYVILRNLLLESNLYVSKHDVTGAKCKHIKVCALYPFGSLRVERANKIVAKCIMLKHNHTCYIAEFPNVYEKD